MGVVPRPSNREAIALDTHRGVRYFGMQRVLDRLRYWWRGMGDAVMEVVKACLPRARVKARFRESSEEL